MLLTSVFTIAILAICPILSNAAHFNNVSNSKSSVVFEDSDDIRFVAIGDWGYHGHHHGHHQLEVAEALGNWCQNQGCQFIVSLGDNFYSRGVDGVDDKQFEETWKEVYSHYSIRNLPWYLTVGNHDHSPVHHRELYQVEYSKYEPRWNLPSLAFGTRFQTSATSLTLVSIDSISLESNVNNAAGMLLTLQDELQNAGADDWKIVFSHFPCHSGGHYAGSSTMRNEVLPIMQHYKVDFYLTGHDHNQQHWVTRGNPRDIDHVTSGAGGAASEYDQWSSSVHENEDLGMELKFFDKSYGFSYFIVSREQIRVQFVDDNGIVMHEFTRPRY